MMKYSSISGGNCSKQDIIDFIKTSNKPCKYTYGFKYRGPSTYEVPISASKAIEYINKSYLIDVEERDSFIDVNEYSNNDMW